MNVLPTQNAQQHLLAGMKNVLILAIVLQMQTARLEIIEAFVHVGQVTQEILILKDADQVSHIILLDRFCSK